MGLSLELISFQATAPGAGAVWLPVAGNSLTVRDTRGKVRWLSGWQQRQGVGFLRTTSPLLHDAVVGITAQGSVGQTIYHEGLAQPMYAQDTVIKFGSGSAVAGQIEQGSDLWWYEDVPGICAGLLTAAEVDKRGIDMYAFTNTLTGVGVAGGYSGSELINSEMDQLKANTDYAIIGCASSIGCTSFRWIGPDWGNVGVGIPGQPFDFIQNRFFYDLSKSTGLACIPYFNSSNKSLVFIDCIKNQVVQTPTVSTICVRLSARPAK